VRVRVRLRLRLCVRLCVDVGGGHQLVHSYGVANLPLTFCPVLLCYRTGTTSTPSTTVLFRWRQSASATTSLATTSTRHNDRFIRSAPPVSTNSLRLLTYWQRLIDYRSVVSVHVSFES